MAVLVDGVQVAGNRGLRGKQGPQGKPGESAYQVAVDNGFVGTEEQWLASLQGPQGIQGPQGEPGTSIDLIFSDGLTKDGETVSVTTPTNGVYTQEEFDSLSDDQKNKGFYVIDDDDPSESLQEIYSTEETSVGTWIDGKPLYRRVVTGTVSIAGSISAVDILDDPAMRLHRASGTFVSSAASRFPIPYYSFDSNKMYFLYVMQSETDHKVQIRGVWSSAKSFPYEAILEYTKSTD